MSDLDKRRHAFRADLADERLKGRVDVPKFVTGKSQVIAVPRASLRREPSPGAMQLTEALLGEEIEVFDTRNGWSWVQLAADGYVGYVESAALAAPGAAVTHRVAVPATFIYPAANLKAQPAVQIPLNARVTVAGGDEKFAALAGGGYVWRAHLGVLGDFARDFVAVAGQFLDVPYYWGGKTMNGLDCSGLVQIALAACGRACPRDSDQQERALGHRLMVNGIDGLARGDLVFWEGHVGIMTDSATLLHANGHHMLTVAEPLARAVDRIAATGKQVTSIRRL